MTPLARRTLLSRELASCLASVSPPDLADGHFVEATKKVGRLILKVMTKNAVSANTITNKGNPTVARSIGYAHFANGQHTGQHADFPGLTDLRSIALTISIAGP